MRASLARYRVFFGQVMVFAHGERALLLVSIVLSVLAAITEAIGFGLLIPIMESTETLGGFGNVPLVGWFSKIFANMSQSQKLIWAASSLLGLTVLRGVLLYAAEIASYSLPPRVESRLKVRVFQDLYKVPISYVESIPAGELTNLTGANPARVGAAIRFVQLLCANSIIVVINTTFMAIISPVVTLAMILIVVLLTLIYKRLSTPSLEKTGRALTRSTSDFSQLFYNTINGMRLVRLSGAAVNAKEQIEKAVNAMRSANLNKLAIEASVYPFFVTAVGTLFCLVLIIVGIIGLGDSAKLLATLVATVYLMTRLLGPVTLINISRTNIAANMDAFDSLEEFFDAASKQYEQDGTTEVKGLSKEVCFQNVSFRYARQDALTLKSFDLTLGKGERVGIIGLSGSGKSTVISLLCRIYRPESGVITVDGVDLSDVKIESWWRQIAVVLQDMVMMRDTVRANLTQGLKHCPDDGEIWRALHAADVSHVVEALPGGLDAILSDRGFGLSGGERQRLSFARALLRRPGLLILDESTSNLDVQTEARIVDRLVETYPEVTMLVIAHRLGAVRACDRVVVMRDGCVSQEIIRNPDSAEGYPSFHELLAADES